MSLRSSALPPKLLLLTSGLGLGGAEALLIDLALLARDRGWRVEVRSLTAGGHFRVTLLEHGFDVADFGMKRGATSLSALIRSIAAVRASDADIVQCWMYHANFVGGLASLLRRRRPLYLGIFSSMMDFSKYNELTWKMFRAGALLSKLSTGVVYNGERAARDHEQEGYPPNCSIQISNSINFSRFQPAAPSKRRAIRNELGLDDSARVIVAVARNDPQKDWSTMIEIARRHPEFTMLAAGLGTETLDAPANVLRLGPRRDIEAIYAASDVFMLLSRFGEGTSVAMCEAMAMGLPVVTTNVGDNGTMVADGAGEVVPIGDFEATARAIGGIFADPTRRASMSKAAIERVRPLCAPETAFAPLLASYQLALDRTAGVTP